MLNEFPMRIARAGRGNAAPLWLVILTLLLSLCSVANAATTHRRAHHPVVHRLVVDARKGGWVTVRAGAGIYIPPSVMSRSGAVTITTVRRGVYDFKIAVPWHGTVGIHLPFKGRGDTIMHDVGGVWLPEGRRRGQWVVWVTQLSWFTDVNNFFNGVQDALTLGDVSTCLLGHVPLTGSMVAACLLVNNVKSIGGKLIDWIVQRLPGGCAAKIVESGIANGLLHDPIAPLITSLSDPACVPGAGGDEPPSGPRGGAPPISRAPTTSPAQRQSPPATSPAPAGTYPHHVYHTCANGSCGLRVRTAPSLTAVVTATLTDGTQANLVCQTVGSRVVGADGSSSTVWDQIYGGGYAPDFYIDTPGTLGAFSPPIPRCSSAPAPQPQPSPSPSPAPAPAVQLTSPTANATVNGIVALRSTAQNVSGVEFDAYYATNPVNTATIGWHRLGVDRNTTGGYSLDWDSRTIPDQGNAGLGTVNIAAIALDANGNLTAARDYRRVNVNNFAPPPPPPQREAITSYDRMAPGAPYHGYFHNAWQSFTAASNTITHLGVTVGTLAQPAGQAVPYNVSIRLCANQPDANGNCSVIATANPQIINYGNSYADVGDVPVARGATYWVVWFQPPAVNGSTWVTYWWAGGSTLASSDQMQMVVKGYNR